MEKTGYFLRLCQLLTYGERKEDRARTQKRESEKREATWSESRILFVARSTSELTKSTLKKTGIRAPVKHYQPSGTEHDTQQTLMNASFGKMSRLAADGPRNYEWGKQLYSDQYRQWKLFQI